MKTISSVVEEVLQRSPFLMEVMHEGVGNNAEIARRIRPMVEERLMEEVSEGAIGMALHRITKEVNRPQYGARFLKRMSDLTVRSNLVAFAFPNSPDGLSALERISKHVPEARGTFFNLSRGLREVLIIVSEGFAEGLEKTLAPVSGVKKSTGLSAITMHLPEESLSVPGIYHGLLKALAMEGINVVEVVSLRTEFSIIFENKDVDRAFSVLKKITS